MVEREFDVVVVGNVGVDTNGYLSGDEINFNVEANFTENIDCVGQAGGYASRGYAQLDRWTAFIGHVGDDHNGRFVRKEFARDGVDTTGLFIDSLGTSRSANFVYRDGRRKNFYDGKGHMHLHHLHPEGVFVRTHYARQAGALFPGLALAWSSGTGFHLARFRH
jgi:sugar/nucleoside kinase (ribokinase family)